jgi:hypothetical protein
LPKAPLKAKIMAKDIKFDIEARDGKTWVDALANAVK